jgi:hypothetical protein
MAYVHYKHNETYVALGMDVAVERATRKINVERVACAHDCGQIINPDGVRAQVEGCILQTLSRVLKEEVKFDRSRVLSVDWSSYPILTLSEAPKLDIELIDRPSEPPLAPAKRPARRSRRLTRHLRCTGVRLRTVPFTQERRSMGRQVHLIAELVAARFGSLALLSTYPALHRAVCRSYSTLARVAHAALRCRCFSRFHQSCFLFHRRTARSSSAVRQRCRIPLLRSAEKKSPP